MKKCEKKKDKNLLISVDSHESDKKTRSHLQKPCIKQMRNYNAAYMSDIKLTVSSLESISCDNNSSTMFRMPIIIKYNCQQHKTTYYVNNMGAILAIIYLT